MQRKILVNYDIICHRYVCIFKKIIITMFYVIASERMYRKCNAVTNIMANNTYRWKKRLFISTTEGYFHFVQAFVTCTTIFQSSNGIHILLVEVNFWTHLSVYVCFVCPLVCLCICEKNAADSRPETTDFKFDESTKRCCAQVGIKNASNRSQDTTAVQHKFKTLLRLKAKKMDVSFSLLISNKSWNDKSFRLYSLDDFTVFAQKWKKSATPI